MDEPRNPTREQDLPGAVSDQNGEEAEPGHADQGRAGQATGGNDHGHGGGTGDASSGGESGEGSQSTGDPNSAG